MKLSIVTIVFNNKETIAHAITSVLSQTFENVEYILIDGGSTDGTVDIINGFADSIARIVSEPDLGIYDAMNKGIRIATGDVIGILNSDDFYEDKYVLHDVMTHFTSNRNLSIIYGNLRYVDRINIDKVKRNWISTSYYNKYFEEGNVPPHPTLFVRSIVYKEVGLFNLEYKLAADYEFMLRVFKTRTYKFKYLNRYMVRMRLGGASNKNLTNIYNQNIEVLKSWRNNNIKPPVFFIFARFIKKLCHFHI